jgi:hypothetical protein
MSLIANSRSSSKSSYRQMVCPLHQSLHEAVGSRMSQVIVVGAYWHPKFWVNIVHAQMKLCTPIPFCVHAQAVARGVTGGVRVRSSFFICASSV